MAHNNKTPASILTAPLQVVRTLVSHTPTKIEDPDTHEVVGMKMVPQTHSQDYIINPLTGEARNENRSSGARRARALSKRLFRNKGGRKQKRHNKD
jgi:hypothetical protein